MADSVRERQILFSAPMVRALMAGTKTQTRRPVKGMALEWLRPEGFTPEYVAMRENGLCPYGFAGDRLWVREAWQYADWTDDGEPWIAYAAGGEDLLCRTFDEEWNYRLGDIWAELSSPDNYNIDGRAADRRWRPSIHMPRWASRITLEVTGVRVERLQDISEADAMAEGIVATHGGFGLPNGSHYHAADPRQSYFSLFEAINGPGSVEANPWLWVVSFPPASVSSHKEG